MPFIISVDIIKIKERLKRYEHMLQILLECQFGLLDELCDRHVLTNNQVNKIRIETEQFNKNTQLLQAIDQLLEVRKLYDFLDALRATGQGHLSTYIISDGSKFYNTIIHNESHSNYVA